MPITTASEIRVWTSIWFLLIAPQMNGEFHRYAWKWDLVQATKLLRFSQTDCAQMQGVWWAWAHRLQCSREQTSALPGPEAPAAFQVRDNTESPVLLLHAPALPEARLTLGLAKQVGVRFRTADQIPSKYPQGPKSPPPHSSLTPGGLPGGESHKLDFFQIFTSSGCCFSPVLLFLTSSQSFAWASSTVLHLYFPDSWLSCSVQNNKPKRKIIMMFSFGYWILM